jgi:pimeloyl-ACP methyl ester carboxylesterase
MNIKRAMPLISVFFMLYLSACAYLYYNQRAFLYYPSPVIDVPRAESISLASDGETLRIWHVGPSDGDAIIYFGGNAEAVGELAPYFATHFPHRAVYLVNYRSYGGSTGLPSEQALFQDALTVYDFVHAKHANIEIVGRSLGTGVAVYLTTQRVVKKLLLTTPYDSIESLAKNQFPVFPVSLLLKDKFASVERVSSIAIPTMILLAETDNTVPHKNTQVLVEAFRKTTPQQLQIRHCSHDSILSQDAYWQTATRFLD